MLDLDLERVKANVAKADTTDLLDRATVYRNGMEPEALEVIDEELRARGNGDAEIAAHRARRAGTIYAADGLALKCGCSRCPRPAVARKWGWHFLWGVVPLFPRPLTFCDEHLPAAWREKPAFPYSGDGPAPTPPSRAEAGIKERGVGVRPPSSD